MNRPYHILLIEDDEEDAFLFGKLLSDMPSSQPAVLSHARTLAEGARRIGNGGIDVALLDLSLPDSSGSSTFEQLREQCPSIPIVVLTGLDDESLAISIMQKGAQDYLVKGRFSARTLRRSIRYAIQRQQLVRELEYKNAELEELGVRMKTLIDSNTDGMLIVSPDGKIQFANLTAERLYESPPGALTGQMYGVPSVIKHPIEITIVRPNSKYLLAEMRVVPTVWRRAAAYLILLRDITVRKRSEDALRMYRDHLKDMITRRTRELSEANAQLNMEVTERRRTEVALRESLRRLEANSRAQVDFVSNVSHELKTPIASIGYAVNNLLTGVAGDVPQRARSYLTMMAEDVERLSGTIGDMLDMSRIEARTLVLQQTKLHLSRLVLHTISTIHDLLGAKHQRVTFSAKHDRSFVAVDPKRFERVILNIVGNAMKYTPNQGLIEVRLFSKASEPESVFLTVTDNGIGIPAEHIAHVTERYYRVGEHVDGTGLGLALCKELTEMHGGTLDLASPPQGLAKGTQVTITLPASPPPSVLVVDDEPLVLKLIERQLGAHGYHVVPCSNGIGALDIIESGTIDILIADIMLPSLDGIELISRIKTNHRFQHMPIIVITGALMDGPRAELLDGFDIPVLRKPWKAAELMAAIEDTAAGRHFQRELTP